MQERKANTVAGLAPHSSESAPEVRMQLEREEPALYFSNSELVKEYPDGRRFTVRLSADGRSHAHIRKLLTAEQQARLTALIAEPDGVAAKARAFGVDLSLTVRNALLTPEERWRRANVTIATTRALCGKAIRKRPTPELERDR